VKATYRRQRSIDALASPEAVRFILNELHAALPELIPQREKDLRRLLHAVRHIQRYPATDTKRGRPGRWPREELLKVGARLTDILDRETSARISIASFVDHYVRLLDFSADVLQALAEGEINLFEASQLARLTPAKLEVSTVQASQARADLLNAHRQAKLSGPRLRQRVLEMLRPSLVEIKVENENGLEPDLEDFDPYDPTHLFWDQIKQLGFALRDICREDVMEEEVDELLKASEPVLTILMKIQRRKEKKTIKLQL